MFLLLKGSIFGVGRVKPAPLWGREGEQSTRSEVWGVMGRVRGFAECTAHFFFLPCPWLSGSGLCVLWEALTVLWVLQPALPGGLS